MKMVTFSTSFISFQGFAREFVGELIGTFLLVFLGNNAVAESVLTGGEGGNNVTVYFGYGFGLLLGLMVAGNCSGGHLNPAVTVTAAILNKFQWKKVFHYLLAQYLGAFIGACATYLVYADTFEAFHINNGVNKTTASIFATFPKENLSLIGSFIDQILGSMILVLVIYSVTDPFNKVPGYLAPIYVSLTLISVGCSLGINQGFAINPARDFSPRFFTYISFWGAQVFSYESYWYVTLIGPHIGALIGGSIYVFAFEKTRIVEEGINFPPIATLETPAKKHNFCSTKCAFIDVDAEHREKKLQSDKRKLKIKGPEKKEEFSHF